MADSRQGSSSNFSTKGKTCDALREWLRLHGFPTRGKKAELISRQVCNNAKPSLSLCSFDYVSSYC